MENPWNIRSIYDLQYFNCPSCIFKNSSKQEIINHAYNLHPESIEYLMNIDDNSLMDVSLPWDVVVKKEIKAETEHFGNPVEFEYPINVECMPDIKTGNNYNQGIIIKQDFIEYETQKDLHKCEVCGIVFDKLSHLRTHIKSVHDGKIEYKCDRCDKTFGKTSKLKYHVKTVHEGIKEHKCELCGKCFGLLCHLKTHIKTIHEKQKDYKCQTCGKAYSRLEHLKIHIRSVHEKKKDHKCEFCGKEFCDMSNFKRHIKDIHEREKQHKCKHCGKGFARLEHLKGHIKSVHEKKFITNSFGTEAEYLVNPVEFEYPVTVECMPDIKTENN